MRPAQKRRLVDDVRRFWQVTTCAVADVHSYTRVTTCAAVRISSRRTASVESDCGISLNTGALALGSRIVRMAVKGMPASGMFTPACVRYFTQSRQLEETPTPFFEAW